MLIIEREAQQSFYINDAGEQIEVKFIGFSRPGRAIIGIEADRKYKILRDDIVNKEEKKLPPNVYDKPPVFKKKRFSFNRHEQND